MGSLNALPYWHVNVPENERTEECPDFLCNLSPKDVGIIGTPDSEYHVATWEEVQQIIQDNRLDAFRRVPSHLRRYLGYTSKIRQDYGSVMNFILTQRLHWEAPVVSKGKPFELEEDAKILQNDWPYGIDKRIVHLVVWTKFDLEEDPVTADLTDKARDEIETYCQQKFGAKLSRDQVTTHSAPFSWPSVFANKKETKYIWFKNWRSLKSVHAVEHFHVMIFNPDPTFIDEVTGGDIPLCDKV